MTDETRRRQKREALMAKAKQMQEADRKSHLEAISLFIESRRSLKKLYSPEAGAALFRNLFGGKHRKADIGE